VFTSIYTAHLFAAVLRGFFFLVHLLGGTTPVCERENDSHRVSSLSLLISVYLSEAVDVSAALQGGMPAVSSDAAPAFPSEEPMRRPATTATLEKVALHLFHLLHSPPLSLAALVRAGLLWEEEDVQGRYTLVSATQLSSPHKAASSSATATVRLTAEAPLASPVTVPAPTVPSSANERISPADKHNGVPRREKDEGEGLPSLIQQVQNTAAPLSLASPTTAAASPTQFRMARVSSEALAQRLAELYAHHPTYVLREWLHKEAMRLCCPSYQDPLSNDIIATAEALRQRDGLVTLYVHLYEELYVRGGSVGSPTSVTGGTSAVDPEVAAWSRSLHLLMGCHHQHERHCPHRALDGFKRQSGNPSASPHTLARGETARPYPLKSSRDAGASTPVAAAAGQQQQQQQQWGRRQRERLNREASVALRFVQQLLHNTPKLHRDTSRTLQAGQAAAAALAGEGKAYRKGDPVKATVGFEVERGELAYPGATVTFVRQPNTRRVGSQTNAVGFCVATTARDATASPSTKGAARSLVHPGVVQRRPPPVVTSLDCMIGVDDSFAVPVTPPTISADAVNGEDRGTVTTTTTMGAAAAAAATAIPARRGPRIRLDRFLMTADATASSAAPREENIVLDRLAPLQRQRHRRRSRHTDEASCSNGSSRRRSSGSSSSSVSLPVVGEDSEGVLSMSADEESADDDGEEDDEEDVDAANQRDRYHHHSSSKAESADAESREPKCEQGLADAISTRRASSYQGVASTTTMDFLASRNGGLRGAALVATRLTADALLSQVSSVHCQPTQQLGNGKEPSRAVNNCAAAASWVPSPLDLERLETHLDDSTAPSTSQQSNPLLAGYSLTSPFSLAELPLAEAEELLRLPYYAQAHELNRLAGLRGRSCYQDPYTSCLILTSLFLESLPHCYGEYCKHCPHGEVCQRRQLRPTQHHRTDHRHHHHQPHYPWRVVKATTADTAATAHRSELHGTHRTHADDGDTDSSDDSLSGSSSSEREEEEEDDIDSPETVRFFAELDAADAAATVRDMAAAAEQQSHPSPALQTPTTAISAVVAASTKATVSRVFSSPTTPRSSVLSSSSSLSSSHASLFSDGDEDQEEQHRHHLLRSAALFTEGEGAVASTAGVVVQVNSLRDLLSWGLHGTHISSSSVTASPLHAAGANTTIPSDSNGASHHEGFHSRASESGTRLPLSVWEGWENAGDTELLLGDDGAVVSEMDMEELLRRHEAFFEQFNYLDYSGL
jgi:hypothetical protein